MALTAIVTKKSVSTVQSKLFNIVFNLILKDNDVEKVNRDFSCEFHPGDNPATKVNEIKEAMQKAIDNYKAEQVIFNAAALDNAVISIEGRLVL